jgi:hypothetical protein
MPVCNDPAISYLKNSGYSVLRLPRRDFKPLQVLMAQGRDLVHLGDLATVMVEGPQAQLPPVRIDSPAATISGTRSSDVSVGVGLTILGSIIGAMGGGKLGLDGQYGRARTMAFEFADVLADDVEIARLDQFLGAADINPASKHVSSLLEADDIYIVTATIKSARFTIEAKDKHSVKVDLSVPEIQGVVGGKVTVTSAGAETGKLSYAGEDPLVFGFQAVQLFYDGGHYTAFEPLESGTMASRALPKSSLPKGVKALAGGGPFARLS